MRVFLPGPTDEDFSARLRSALGADVELIVGPVDPWPEGIEVLVRGRPSEEELEAAGPIRTLVIPYAGVPERTLCLMAGRPEVAVYNLHHNAAPTAEQAMALLLAACKRIAPRDRDMRRGDWSARFAEDRSILLEGRSALILGAGAIGTRLQRACLGLGMEASMVGRRDLMDEATREWRTGLHRRLPNAEVLMLALPMTEETRGMLGVEELSLLPRGCVIVNVARGPILDETALHGALLSGHVAAVGLDVWWRYPENEAERSNCQPSSHPLHELDQVVMSPHLAGHTVQTEALRAQHLADLLQVLACGEEPASRVRIDRGY